jgi:uncharacterized membrane protein
MAVADPAAEPTTAPSPSRLPTLLVSLALSLVFTAWFLNAPSGALGKAASVGYAICHRISVRSFFVGEVQMPLCARCTGMYLGILLGVAIMVGLGRWRYGTLPRRGVIVVMILFITVMGIDGVNSYATLIPGLPHVYEPRNWLRLVTGILTGVAISGLIYPVFNATLWRRWVDKPIVRSLWELGGIVLAAMIVAGLILSNNPYLLYPLALLSALGVLVLMTMTNSVLFMLATHMTNRAQRWRDAWVPVAAGLTVSLAMILLIDVLRFVATRTWDGFIIPGA